MAVAWMRKKRKTMTITWKGSEREVCWAWCVCALLCCVASGSTERAGGGGGAQRGKKATYIGKYGNLRPLNAANTRGNHQKGFLCVFMSMGV